MNKILTKFLTFSVGLAMAIGVGVALKGNETRGARAETRTITFTMAGFGGTSSGYQNSAVSGKDDGKTINASAYAYNQSTGQVRGNKTVIKDSTVNDDNGGNWHLFNTTAIPGAITGISVTTANPTKDNYFKGTLYVALATSATGSRGDVTSVTGAASATPTKTGGASYANNFSFTFNESNNYRYFKVMSSVAFTNGSVTSVSVVVSYSAGDTPTPTTFTVSYDGNGNTGGVVPEDVSEYSSGSSVTVLGNTGLLTRTNYAFAGWTLNEEGTGTIYGPDAGQTAKYAIDSNTTFYAKWTPKVVEGTFKKYSGPIVAGDYLISSTYSSNNGAMNNIVSSNRLQINTITPVSDIVSNPSVGIVWSISKSGDYWTIYNSEVEMYAAATGTKNQAQLLTDGTDDKSLWTITGSSNYTITNKKNSSSSVNAKLSRNEDYGFATYSSGSVALYKKMVNYTITYDANGGTSTMADTVNVVAECSFTAPTEKEFDHWNTEADDTGETYAPGATVEEDLTLYAIWRWIPPSVEINKDEIEFTVGSSSTTVVATASHITDITYSWQRTAGDDCVTLTNTNTSTVTVEPKGDRIGLCTLTLTVNGNNGGEAITPIVKTVSIVLKRTPTDGNPYNVQEAIKAIDNNLTVSNVYVRAIVCEVIQFDTTNKWITYDISDDGTTTNAFRVYRGKDKNGANFSSINDVQVGDIVVVKGDILLYNSSIYEFSAGSQRVSYERVTITGIAVKTAPTKTQYIYNEDFDPTGLVITVTFSNGDTTDVAYAGHESDFEFSISKVTSSTNVTITYAEETCTQAVTLLTVSRVTGATVYPTSIYVGDSISGSDVTLSVLYSDGERTGTVQANHVDVDSTKVAASVIATAWYTADESDDNMKATFNVEIKKVPIYVNVTDEIDLAFTGVSGTSYTSWSNKSSNNGAVYSGNNAGGNDSIQIRYASSGLYTSVSAGKLYSVEVVWNTNTVNGRSINVYGSNTAFSSISTEGAESLGSITKNTSTTVVDDDFEYSYLLITGNGDALYIDKIIVTWKVEGTDNVMTKDPVLSLDSSSIYVGRTTTLRVATTPEDSDEKLNVTSSDPTVATVSGSGKAYTVRGVSEGTATITVTGKQSGLSSSIDIEVNNAIKTCEDKILDDVTLEITGSYSTDAEKSLDGVTYVVNDVLKSNGLQFKSSSGYIYNSATLFDVNDIPAAIKAVTLVMQSKNTSVPLVYEGNAKNPSTPVIFSGTFSQDGVNTYTFSGTTKYFKVAAGTNATYIEKIIVELVDSADDHLTLARSAANTILTKLGGLCGTSGSGFVTPAKWQELNNALTALNLTDRAKEILRIAVRNNRLNNLSQGSATIETAMYHYDACVTKFGYTPFDGITTARASFRPNVSLFSSPQNLNTSLIVIISSIVAIASFAGYFYYKKKKDN